VGGFGSLRASPLVAKKRRAVDVLVLELLPTFWFEKKDAVVANVGTPARRQLTAAIAVSAGRYIVLLVLIVRMGMR
jgi:hypothetical protein